jgi:plastocyanin
MAQTQEIDINRMPGQSLAEFDPGTLTAAVGDLIFWSNGDEHAAHWPARIGNDGQINKTSWFDAEIPIKLKDDPAPASDYVFFNKAQTVQYACALHPHETGTIIVA